jgi:hypothetical protein
LHHIALGQRVHSTGLTPSPPPPSTCDQLPCWPSPKNAYVISGELGPGRFCLLLSSPQHMCIYVFRGLRCGNKASSQNKMRPRASFSISLFLSPPPQTIKWVNVVSAGGGEGGEKATPPPIREQEGGGDLYEPTTQNLFAILLSSGSRISQSV